MLFNSATFLIFFPLVLGLYFALPQRFRQGWLLLTSYAFYMAWHPAYILLILFSTGVDYTVGLRMSHLPDRAERRKYLWLSLFCNLGLLFSFKYFNFFSSSLHNWTGWDTPLHTFLLPVGISFYTFQTLSYTIDVYLGRISAEKSPLVFALYVAFWPQLVAGPIERSQRLLPQFHKPVHFDYDRVRSGLLRMLWGFFKKIVIADRLAAYVDMVYDAPNDYYGVAVLLATYFFAFQIYCDFSGYSDIAIGAARVLGFDLMENFRAPYLARSVREFWRRWHISLSTWFRDYVYIPLGGSRTAPSRMYANLFVTFVISGLWHGANWTFVIWGTLHGLFIIIETITQPYRQKWRVPPLISTVFTFHLVLFGWLFFRANSLSDALLLLTHLTQNLTAVNIPLPRGEIDGLISIGLIAFLCCHEYLLQGNLMEKSILIRPKPIRWVYYLTIFLSILWFGVFTQNQFIYFQF